MRRFLAAVVGLGASLALVGSAAAAPSAGAAPGSHKLATVTLPWSGLAVGVNDDGGKLDSLRDWFYPVMSDDGLSLNTLTIQWNENDPFTIPAQENVKSAIAAAQANGISIALDLYPLHSQAFTHGKRCRALTDPRACGDGATIAEFAGWTAQVASAFPTVHQFVVMNECNQPLFLNPQWNASRQNQSAAICGRALAASYDALKATDRTNFVWGVGLSPRGNDNARAASNSSTSPIRFLGYLGTWFAAFAKKTHRKAPLMDGFDFHPYPVPQSLPFTTGYANPKDASVTNLPRVYQAFYDGFNGSPQRTIGQQKGGGLPVSLNETGIQTASPGTDYVGWEVSATPAGGVIGRWATQSYQARWYLEMLNLVSCDPNVHLVNIFHLVDETDLAGWQSGLYFADESQKQSAPTIRSWLASTGGTCQGTKMSWKPGVKITLPVIDLSKLKLPSFPSAAPPTSDVNAQPAANAAAGAVAPPALPQPPAVVANPAGPADSTPPADAPAPADAPPPSDQAPSGAPPDPNG
jgi:hypothetical protein